MEVPVPRFSVTGPPNPRSSRVCAQSRQSAVCYHDYPLAYHRLFAHHHVAWLRNLLVFDIHKQPDRDGSGKRRLLRPQWRPHTAIQLHAHASRLPRRYPAPPGIREPASRSADRRVWHRRRRERRHSQHTKTPPSRFRRSPRVRRSCHRQHTLPNIASAVLFALSGCQSDTNAIPSWVAPLLFVPSQGREGREGRDLLFPLKSLTRTYVLRDPLSTPGGE